MAGFERDSLDYSSAFIAFILLGFLFVRFKRSWKLFSSGSDTGKFVRPFKEEKHESNVFDSVESMGVIQPLTDLDWETVEPKRVYKFSPKYFLTMGLQNTTINNITHIDRLYLTRLAARQKILKDHPNAVACLPSAVGMVNELYSYLICTYLPRRYPTIFHLHPPHAPATHLLNTLTHDLLPLTPPSDPLVTLRSLATTLDDDFIMLLPCSSPSSSSPAPSSSSPQTETGSSFSLQAYIWCYPAGFVPSKLLGLPLAAIHAPVPGYASKLEKSMDRYFSRLEVGRVVTRSNWSIATTPSLWEDGLSGSYHYYEDQAPSPADRESIDISQCSLRCELQTLFALPKSGGRVLGLHLYMYALEDVREEEGGKVAIDLCDAIEGLTRGNVPEIARYKRAMVWEDKVKEFLKS